MGGSSILKIAVSPQFAYKFSCCSFCFCFCFFSKNLSRVFQRPDKNKLENCKEKGGEEASERGGGTEKGAYPFEYWDSS